jgi:epoxide hydrolase-like predicted phosphatase
MVGEVPESAVWDFAIARYGLDSEQALELQHDFWAGDQLNMELVAFMDELRPRYRMAILSNAWSKARADFNDRFELEKLVDLMIISAEEGVAKPDPRIYQLTLERLSVKPEETIFIDDLVENVVAAQAIGMHGVRFKSNAQAIGEVRRILADTGSPS